MRILIVSIEEVKAKETEGNNDPWKPTFDVQMTQIDDDH
jgi:hypothetical protein